MEDCKWFILIHVSKYVSIDDYFKLFLELFINLLVDNQRSEWTYYHYDFGPSADIEQLNKITSAVWLE